MSAPTITCAVLTGMAVWLWLPAPDLRLRALTGAGPSGRAVPRWLTPVPGAPSIAVRLGVSLVIALAVVASVPTGAGLGGAGLIGVISFFGLGRLSARSSARDELAITLQMPETLDLLAACLDAGAPLRWAVREVARRGPPATRPALARVLAQVGVGVPDGQAWRSLAVERAWSTVADDLARCAETGTAVAGMLRQHAGDARGRRRDELMSRARAVGVRSVLPLMCCFLPAFLLTGVVPVVAGLLGNVLHR